jgi:tryptophanyl-tRNA synthetase
VEAAGPGVLNLLAIYQAFSGWSDEQMKQYFNGMRYGGLKKQVAEMVVSELGPFQQRYQQIVSDAGYLDRVLDDGAARVKPIAEDTVRLTKERMGLWPGSLG